MPVNPTQKLNREKRDKEIKQLYPLFTMEKIGKRYKICRERVRQIIKGRRKENRRN